MLRNHEVRWLSLSKPSKKLAPLCTSPLSAGPLNALLCLPVRPVAKPTTADAPRMRAGVTNLKFHRVTLEISFRFVQKTLKISDKRLSCSFVN